MGSNGTDDAGTYTTHRHVPHKWRFTMSTLTLVLIVFLLILVLGMQFQITSLNKKINEALRRKQKKKYF
jgi:hypothetical protein